MDVLEYYDPPIDWSRFQRGKLSDDVWGAFGDLVRLCHAYRYWTDAVTTQRRTRPTPSLYSESKYMKRKRRQEWRNDIVSLEDHKYRAAFLAGEKIWGIAHMVDKRNATPDWHLSLALMKAVGVKHIMNTMTGHERANFEVLAFSEFDAGTQISADSDAMAVRWRAAAGYQSNAA